MKEDHIVFLHDIVLSILLHLPLYTYLFFTSKLDPVFNLAYLSAYVLGLEM
jgi:hypothetical protein